MGIQNEEQSTVYMSVSAMLRVKGHCVATSPIFELPLFFQEVTTSRYIQSLCFVSGFLVSWFTNIHLHQYL